MDRRGPAVAGPRRASAPALGPPSAPITLSRIGVHHRRRSTAVPVAIYLEVMRILKVVDGEYPWDVRVEKLSLALTRADHEVHIVARNRDGRVLKERLAEGTVHRMAPWRLLGRRFDAASQFPAFLNPRWFRLILSVGRRVQAERILVRDLPLAPTAIAAGRLLGVPVVLDMAENYPAMIHDLWTTGSTRFGDVIVRNPKAVEAVERWTMARVDHTLVVVEESRDRLVRDLGVNAERITVVGNTPSLDRLDASPERPADPGATARPLQLVYLGLLEQARGVGTAIDAVATCRDRGVPVAFTVIGDGRARGDFEAQRRRLGLDEGQVRLLGFLPYAEALRNVAMADAGIIPHLANDSWNTTVPNKLFDYMAAGLCVITSDARPAKRIVEEERAGFAFTSGDAASLAGVLERVWRDGTARELGRNGRAAIRARHHWERDAARLERVFAGSADGAPATWRERSKPARA
jgi:glycosyltransferase involved in cell wall biosynthesis